MNVIGSRWVYTVKRDEFNQIVQYKARFVARGFNQIKDIDYDETFSPVGQNVTMRALLTFATKNDYPVYHFDVSMALVIWIKMFISIHLLIQKILTKYGS